jgi:hypothetical protein
MLLAGLSVCWKIFLLLCAAKAKPSPQRTPRKTYFISYVAMSHLVTDKLIQTNQWGMQPEKTSVSFVSSVVVIFQAEAWDDPFVHSGGTST